LIEIINKQLLLQLVGYLCYWQMGFNSVFKGLKCTMPMASALSTCCPMSFYEYLFNLVKEILLVFTV